MFGGLLCGTGFALTTVLATNLTTMIILYGFVAGSGLGLMYVPTIISVNYYFDKKRSIANGESTTQFWLFNSRQAVLELLRVHLHHLHLLHQDFTFC